MSVGKLSDAIPEAMRCLMISDSEQRQNLSVFLSSMTFSSISGGSDIVNLDILVILVHLLLWFTGSPDAFIIVVHWFTVNRELKNKKIIFL